MNKIEEAITEYWGPRCPNFNSYCYICQTWKMYDELYFNLLEKCNERQQNVVE